jgi:hypothetical protein
MPIYKALRVVLGWSRYSPSRLYMLGLNVFYRMKDNPYFPAPPVSFADLESVLNHFRHSMTQTIDGGRPKDYAERNHWHAELIVLLRQFAHYVDDTCKGDPANIYMLVTSGFEAQPMSRRKKEPLDIPRILVIEQGPAGVLIAYYTPVGRDAKSYDVGWKKADEPDTPETWKEMKVPCARGGATVKDLTPGTVYAFRVRAYGPLGLTAWSPIVTRMCI